MDKKITKLARNKWFKYCKINTICKHILNICEYRDDLDKEKKLQKKLKLEYDEKIRGLNEKINNLQTTLENTKTDLTFLQKQQKGLSQEKEVMSKDIDILKLKVGQKEDAVHEKEKDIKE